MDISECNSRLFSRYPARDWIFPKWRGIVTVYLFSHSLFLNREGRIVGAGRVRRVMRRVVWGGGVEGNLLNLEPIKDVSGALCLVWSHKSAVLGLVQGHDNTHYSHYLPDRPINSHGRDKVPLSEMLRPIGSLTIISLSARSKSSNGGEETGGEGTTRREKSPEEENTAVIFREEGVQQSVDVTCSRV